MLVSDKIKHNKLLLNKNRQLQEFVNKTNQLRLKNLNRLKTTGLEKCKVTLKVPFINKSSEI